MGAVEDAIAGNDSRALKAWGLALAVAIVSTQMLGAIKNQIKNEEKSEHPH